ncbi:hypothetical protein LJR225_004895 [Phenylobacterium sp. LjRoot225]|uniref:hypothetical protein n=1 Tax=Phenylobacterium sp. LjRoot225 TaxID=3342285 RepID=UPI003ECEFD2F
MTNILASSVDHVRGDATGLAVPAHGEALRAGGEAFLTQAFRAFGALPADNSVARITRFEPCPGGSTGKKFFLSVEYERPGPDLHTDLFVKFSRDFTDARRDHGRWEMESEVRFAPISRLTGFPISTPVAYFADYHHESGTGLLITQRIAFGEGGIEPHHLKCFDHELDEPLPYYRAILTALARLAAAHKAGRLSPDIAVRFPFEPATAGGDPILYDEDELRAVLADCTDFAARAPQLLPAEIRAPDFMAKLEREALRIREHESTIQAYLRGNPDLVALCHWNAHIDNAWFWRDAQGELQCGLMDWGRVNQITLGAALWGCLSAAHHDVWKHHLDALLALFVREYHEYGGPLVAVEELKLHLTLHVASMGVARVLAFPAIVLFRVPGALKASGPHDPAILGVEPARNCLHVYTVFLNLWRTGEIGASLDRLLERATAAPPAGAMREPMPR